MDALRQQLQRIQEQIAGLTASQRMLVGSLLAIIVMTLLFWSRWAADPEMIPVLDRPISANEMPGIKGALKSAGIDARIVNDRVMVPAEKQLEALSILGYGKLLPTDSADAWDEIVNKQSNPFESAEKAGARANRAKEVMLSQIIASFPGVTKATVLIDPTDKRRLGPGGNIEPTASVSISAKSEASIDGLVEASSSTVASAHAGLKQSKVGVVINGNSYRPRDSQNEDSAYISADWQKQLREEEEYFIAKITRVMTFPGAVVTVTADMDTETSEETKKSYNEKETFQKEKSTESETSETQAGATIAPAEPGAEPNTGLSIDPNASGGTGGTTTERQRNEFENFPSETLKHTKKPGGKTRITRASVRLPRSQFYAIWRHKNQGTTSKPDDATIEAMIKEEIEKTRDQIVGACSAPVDAIAVSVYEDLTPMFATAESDPAAAAGGSSFVSGLLKSHAKEIAIAGLAITSLFMVSMMVRRGGTPVVAATIPVALQEIAPLATAEHIAGEVGEGSAMLDGMELDEDTIKAQQMVEQVSTMVEENPDAAANLVKRWLNRT